jgi:hypothetical protein
MTANDEAKRYIKFNKILSNIPYRKLKEIGDQDHKRAESEYREFKTALEQGLCSYCGQPLKYFLSDRPCIHWLLNPKGFKKKFFPLLYAQRGFHQIEAYLRWLANTEVPIKNINDLALEKNPSKIIELTIKYKNLEWSFSCSRGDYKGHENKHDGQMPHFHFQMKCNGRVIINYSGFHIPFNDYDKFVFAVKRGNIDTLRYSHSRGSGMQSFIEQISPERLLEGMKRTGNDKKGEFHLYTDIEADPGTTISGDDIADLIKESNETGEPISKLVRKLKNARITTTITPGPAIPKIAGRFPRKRK